MSYDNSYVTSFPDHTFYKGDTISIPFSFFYSDNSPIDLRRVEVRFYLFPYGQPEMKVMFGDKDYKLAVPSGSKINECTVIFYPSETQQIEFTKYTYIPRLFFNDGSGRQYIRGEGHITYRES
ncbi:MAG: hypothetical protein RR806_05660 [Oscillospiraceae bacterium]